MSELNIPGSKYQKDFVPKDAKPIIGIDYANGEDYTVKGFYDTKTGEYHFQEVIYSKRTEAGK